MRPRI
jgi:hypothetical protein